MRQNWLSKNINSITSSWRLRKVFISSWAPNRVLSRQMFTNWTCHKKMRSIKVQISRVHNKEFSRAYRTISFHRKLLRRNWISLHLQRGCWSRASTIRPTPWYRRNSRTWNSQMWHVSSREFSKDCTRPWVQTLWCRQAAKWNQETQLFQSLLRSWSTGSQTCNTRLLGEFYIGCKRTSLLKNRPFKLENKR